MDDAERQTSIASVSAHALYSVWYRARVEEKSNSSQICISWCWVKGRAVGMHHKKYGTQTIGSDCTVMIS